MLKIKKEGTKILNAKMVTKRKYEAVRGKDCMLCDRFLSGKGVWRACDPARSRESTCHGRHFLPS